MYEVIKFFTDLQDNDYPYNVGDQFPRDGFSVSEKRIEELSGVNNRQCVPLIKKVGEKKEKTNNNDTPKYTKTDIARMNKNDLLTVGENVGVPNASSMNGNELKKAIVEKLGL